MKPALSIAQPLRPVTFALAFVTGWVTLRSYAAEYFIPEEKAYYLCAGCHGPDAGSVLYPMPHDIPTIIGQKKDYLLKQLISYREGHRKHPNMSDILSSYTDQNLADLADYYEGLGPKRPGRTPRITPPAAAPIPSETTSPAVHLTAHASKKKAKKAKPATDGQNTSH